jgi:hypothetical protein
LGYVPPSGDSGFLGKEGLAVISESPDEAGLAPDLPSDIHRRAGASMSPLQLQLDRAAHHIVRAGNSTELLQRYVLAASREMK